MTAHPLPITDSGVGTTQSYPTGTLSRLAAIANVSPKHLSTVTVSCSTLDAYLAIVDYAAQFHSDGTSLPFAPLCIMPEKPYEGKDYNNRLVKLNRAELFKIRLSIPQNTLKAVGKRRALIPRFHLGIGETVVLWPPPPHLEASRLSNASKDTDNTCHKVQEDGADKLKSEMSVDKCSETEERKSIFVVHYKLGQSHKTDADIRQILLASPEGPHVLRRFCKEVISWRIEKDYKPRDGSNYELYRYKKSACSGQWYSQGLRKARPASSVVLRESMLKTIREDVRTFLAAETEDWYAKHAMPFRRSFLFYGAPGTGKTSTIRALASEFGLNCCYLSMTDSHFSNQDLADALSTIPSNPLLVLEDVDCLFDQKRNSKHSASLSFSGVLNSLDGVISMDGVITVMTTNHIDRLDSALIRGGRVDRRFHFALPENDEMRLLFLTFYPDAAEKVVAEFAQKVLDRPEGDEARCIATLQQLFVVHRKDSAEDCVKGIGKFYTCHFAHATGTLDSVSGMYS